MMHTNMPRNCVALRLLREPKLFAISGSHKINLTQQNDGPCQFTKYKENHTVPRHTRVDHHILLLNHIDFSSFDIATAR